MPKRRPATMTVPEAGELLGVSRSLAYDAARSGELPTIRLGTRLVVPVSALEELLGTSLDDLEDAEAEPAPTA